MQMSKLQKILWGAAVLSLVLLFNNRLFSEPCDLVIDNFQSYDGIRQAYKLSLLSDDPTTGPALKEPDYEWVDKTMQSMSIDEKIGQLIVTSFHTYPTGENNIDNYKVGGFVFLGNGQKASDIVASVNRLQKHSKIPLWFSIDAEAGLGARVADATIFPLIMAFGAVNDPYLTEQCGRITARECRALGIQVAYGPVVDVNTEPINPIISTRSFGDNPDHVARLARNFLKGARAEGALCTFKHYPGHGATTGDSHSSLPTVSLSMSELKDMHIKPYSLLAATNDVDLVMTAHVWYSQVDTAKPWPATLSSIFLKDVLRTEIKYNGIIISDSYGMSGLSLAVPDEQERAIVGIEAGLDIILNPPSVQQAFDGIKSAVNSGRIKESTINNSVRRVLIAKSRAGLPEMTTVDTELYKTVLQHPKHIETVKKVCEKAFTTLKYDFATSPVLKSLSKPLVLALEHSKTIFYTKSYTFFTDPLKAAVPNADIRFLSKSLTTNNINQIVADAPNFDMVIVAGYDLYSILSSSQVNLINKLTDLNVPVVYISFGAPYHYSQIPKVDIFYCGYASVQQMQETAVEVLLGNQKAEGESPAHFDIIHNSQEWIWH